VLRGGSWNNDANNCRSANRNRNTPDNRNTNNGFRVCLSVPAAQGTGWMSLTEPDDARTRPSGRVTPVTALVACAERIVKAPFTPFNSDVKTGLSTRTRCFGNLGFGIEVC